MHTQTHPRARARTRTYTRTHARTTRPDELVPRRRTPFCPTQSFVCSRSLRLPAALPDPTGAPGHRREPGAFPRVSSAAPWFGNTEFTVNIDKRISDQSTDFWLLLTREAPAAPGHLDSRGPPALREGGGRPPAGHRPPAHLPLQPRHEERRGQARRLPLWEQGSSPGVSASGLRETPCQAGGRGTGLARSAVRPETRKGTATVRQRELRGGGGGEGRDAAGGRGTVWGGGRGPDPGGAHLGTCQAFPASGWWSWFEPGTYRHPTPLLPHPCPPSLPLHPIPAPPPHRGLGCWERGMVKEKGEGARVGSALVC